MKKEWSELSTDSAEKQEKRFQRWLLGEGISFVDAEAESMYRDKITLIKDAIQLKKTPKRTPVCPSPGHFPLEYAGISFYDAMYDMRKVAEAWKKFYSEFAPDTFSSSFIGSGKILDLLDSKSYLWAGHGLDKDSQYQFIEKEFMLAEEYEELLNDPTWFHLIRYLPRACGSLKVFEKLPAIVNMRHMSSMAGALLPLSTPEVQEALSMLMEAGKVAAHCLGATRELNRYLAGRGTPPLVGGMSEAPFDTIGDSYRGTRGVLTDMFRHPESLLEACEKFVMPLIKKGVAMADASGVPLIFMPLHKGADEFMSKKQFEQFYWPTLRKVLMGLINEGIVPLVFAEAGFDSRLEIISDLPKARAIWWFEKTDMSRAKKILGETCCIMGNVPNDLLSIGTPAEVEYSCRELIDNAGKDGGFILSTAAGMQGAKPENVKTMIESVKS